MFRQSEQQMQGLKPGMNLVSSHQGKKASAVEVWEGWGGKMILDEIQGIGERWIVCSTLWAVIRSLGFILSVMKNYGRV